MVLANSCIPVVGILGTLLCGDGASGTERVDGCDARRKATAKSSQAVGRFGGTLAASARRDKGTFMVGEHRATSAPFGSRTAIG